MNPSDTIRTESTRRLYSFLQRVAPPDGGDG